MDWLAHRQGLIEHCIWMYATDPAYAGSAVMRYARLPHLVGFAEEVQAERQRRNSTPTTEKEKQHGL
jgi:hypothetical protein